MDPSQPPTPPFLPNRPTPHGQNNNLDHAVSDVDASKFSKHHTLGVGANQSSPGNHYHDGINSKLIPASSISELNDVSTRGDLFPVWKSSGTQPAIGNGFCDGWYVRLGYMLHYGLRWLAGSTTTYGTGQYRFELPFNFYNLGKGFYLAAGLIQNGGTQFPANAWIHGTNNAVDFITPSDAKTGGIGGDSISSLGWKAAWAAGDFIAISGWAPIDD